MPPLLRLAKLALIPLSAVLSGHLVERLGRRRATARTLATVASDLGFRQVRSGLAKRSRRRLNGLEVTVDVVTSRSEGRHFAITIDSDSNTDARIPASLELDTIRTGQAELPPSASGDPQFDGATRCSGPEDLLLATLTAPARQRGLELQQVATWSLTQGQLRCRVPWDVDAERLRSCILTAVDFAQQMTRARGPVVEQLRSRLVAEPDPRVRVRILEVLNRHHGAGRDTKAINRWAVEHDASKAVVLAACRWLGEDGDSVAVELLADLATDRELRLQALELILGRAPERLTVAAEESLLDLLEPTPRPRRLPIIQALGIVGTGRAIGALRHSVGPLAAIQLRTAAQQALDRIESRIGSEHFGRLSVAAEVAGEGALSEAEPGGGLSFARSTEDD